MHGGARVGGSDCDEQAHKGEVAHDIAVLAQKRAVADAVAPGSRLTARRPFRAVLGSLGWWPASYAWPMAHVRTHWSGHGPVLSTPQSLDCSLDKLPQLFPK